MIFPSGIIGPKFCDGDLVAFKFAGAELTLRLPVIPLNKNNKDYVCATRDLRNPRIYDWSEDDQGNRCENLSSQSWSFEDAKSRDNVALATISVSLLHIAPEKLANNNLLCFRTFEKTHMDGLTRSFQSDENDEQTKKRFSAKRRTKDTIDWLDILIQFDLERTPSPTVFIPLTQSLALMVLLEVDSLHYPGRTNPYSEEVIKKFEMDLFEDFLSHVKIDYSEETLAEIASLNAKTPA